MSIRNICLSVAVLILASLVSGCSHPDNSRPVSAKAMFRGCPITSAGEDFSGGASAIPKGIFSSTPNDVYAVGVVRTPGSMAPNVPDQGITRRSTDGGNVFSTIDQTTGPKGQGAVNNAVAADASNTNIYVAQTYNGDSANIRYSNDGGATWKNAPFQFNSKNKEKLVSVALSSGKAYFVGTSEDPSQTKTGFIISVDILDTDKNAPQLVDSLENAEFKQIAIQGNNLFVVGSKFSSTDTKQTSWLLRSWDNIEKKWQNLPDNFPNVLDDTIIAATTRREKTPIPSSAVQTPLSGSANAILITPDGYIFVAGTVKSLSGNGPEVWVVRRSANSGQSFATSDLFNDGAFNSLVPNALVNYDNHVIAVGGSKSVSPDGKTDPTDSHWHVRGAQDRYTNWITLSSPKFSTNPKELAQAVGAVMTGVGDNQKLIVLGNSHEKDGIHHWRIQQTTSCARPPSP